MSFRCVVVTPEQQALDETVTQAILPAHDGMIGIQTNRAPLLVKLGIGPLRVDLQGGKQRTFFVDSGIAQMKDNVLTVLTEQALLPEEIDVQAASAELEAAKAMPTKDARSLEQRQRAMARGAMKQKLASTQAQAAGRH